VVEACVLGRAGQRLPVRTPSLAWWWGGWRPSTRSLESIALMVTLALKLSLRRRRPGHSNWRGGVGAQEAQLSLTLGAVPSPPPVAPWRRWRAGYVVNVRALRQVLPGLPAAGLVAWPLPPPSCAWVPTTTTVLPASRYARGTTPRRAMCWRMRLVG